MNYDGQPPYFGDYSTTSELGTGVSYQAFSGAAYTNYSIYGAVFRVKYIYTWVVSGAVSNTTFSAWNYVTSKYDNLTSQTGQGLYNLTVNISNPTQYLFPTLNTTFSNFSILIKAYHGDNAFDLFDEYVQIENSSISAFNFGLVNASGLNLTLNSSFSQATNLSFGGDLPGDQTGTLQPSFQMTQNFNATSSCISGVFIGMQKAAGNINNSILELRGSNTTGTPSSPNATVFARAYANTANITVGSQNWTYSPLSFCGLVVGGNYFLAAMGFVGAVAPNMTSVSATSASSYGGAWNQFTYTTDGSTWVYPGWDMIIRFQNVVFSSSQNLTNLNTSQSWLANSTLYPNSANLLRKNAVSNYTVSIPFGSNLSWVIIANAYTNGGNTTTGFNSSNGWVYDNGFKATTLTASAYAQFGFNVSSAVTRIGVVTQANTTSNACNLNVSGSSDGSAWTLLASTNQSTVTNLSASSTAFTGNAFYLRVGSNSTSCQSFIKDVNLSIEYSPAITFNLVPGYNALQFSIGSNGANLTSGNLSWIENYIEVSNCSTLGIGETNYNLTFNFYDEDSALITPTLVNASMQAVFLVSSENNQLFNYTSSWSGVGNATMCVSGPNNLTVTTQQEYSATGYSTRNYYISNLSLNQNANYSLYSYPTTDSIQTAVTFQDASFRPRQNVIASFQRYFPGNNTYLAVAMCKTDLSGLCTIPLKAPAAYYDISLYDGYTLLYRFTNVQFPCVASVCSRTLTETATQTANLYYNRTAVSCAVSVGNVSSCSFTVLTGEQHSFNYTVYNLTSNRSIVCTQLLTASGGTMICALGDLTGQSYSYAIQESVGSWLTRASGTIGAVLPLVRSWGQFGLFISIITLLGIALVGLESPKLSLLAGMVGVSVLAFLGLISSNASGYFSPQLYGGLLVILGIGYYAVDD